MTKDFLVNILSRYYSVPTARETIPKKGSADKIVMIVDDDQDLRVLLRDRLERWGMICVEAENGEVAKAQLKKMNVDLLITDYRMPQMDGLELIDWLKQTQRHVPIIFVSGDLSLPIRKKAEKVGVYAILEKPCSLSELSSKVEEVLNQF